MVNLLRSALRSPYNPPGACAVAFVCALFALSGGCQPSSRFAEGSDAPPVDPYIRFTETTPATPNAPPTDSVTIKPIPPMNTVPPVVDSRFPLAWSPRVSNRPWRWIVVHHSATSIGGAARFDKEHRALGWDELGYHFVIGNGTDTRDGQIEVGPRWNKQKHGAHAKTPDNRFNELGIGVCLVGNFENGRPTQQQLRSLATLTAYLMQRYGVPENRVIGHDDTGKNTACPGHNLEAQLPVIRRLAGRAVANGFAATERKAVTAGARGR